MLGKNFLVLASVSMAWCQITSELFVQYPMGPLRVSNESRIRNVTVRSNMLCLAECLRDEGCLAVEKTNQNSGGVQCVLLNDTDICDSSMVPDPRIKYYQKSSRLRYLKWVIHRVLPGPNSAPDASTIWRADCNANFCQQNALIGFIEIEGDTLDDDIDHIICASYSGGLQLDLSKSVTVPIKSDEPKQCPEHMVITGVWDPTRYFGEPKLVKCSPLKNGWKVDQNKCETLLVGSSMRIECKEIDGQPTLMVGMHCNADESIGFDDIKCCALFR